ncbi:MAG: Beta-hexosaminidase, GH3 family [Candidatus Saccharicenans subterraneus]|uniref:beta-N-acetylhexosaminidase n=1 Tax=Candidatus Saccharicenans subterraneus TaxID=2508984 RepID=A0A3E2BLD4_9BACT|nr:MAG: Beta-hexosaminidase, GH3 family [Candidatus Saccharicenans subterraneum]
MKMPKSWNWLIPTILVGFMLNCAPGVKVQDEANRFPGDRQWVEKTIRKMTLDEKIGQLVVARYTGEFFNYDSPYLKNLEELVGKYHLGGLILFGGEALETAYFTNHFQKLAKVPLLIASDLERGAGNQVTGATLFPPLMALGAADSEELAYEMGRITAIEGRALGIHMTYAPVVDVNINPDNPIINTRSVGEDPEQVARITRAFIRGCQGHGMMATAKHFPGHGDTDQDSHSLLPVIKADQERLKKVELYPFQAAIEAGVESIMTAHLYIPALEPEEGLPATLSPRIMTDLLRKQMGFKGLIVTDALEMRGITGYFGDEEAALRALKAGVDLLLLPLDPARVIERLKQAVKSGELPLSRVEESLRRVLLAKTRLGLHRQRYVSLERLPLLLGKQEFREIARKTFSSAITLVKNEGNLLPVRKDKKVVLVSLSSDPGDYYAGRRLATELAGRLPGLRVFYADGDTGREKLDEALPAASQADLVVAALFSSLRSGKGTVDLEPVQAEFIRKLKVAGARVVALSFGSPYFLRHFPEVDGYLCLYRNTPETQELAAMALAGEIRLSGRLPVSLPGLYPRGHGLVLEKIEEAK